MPQPLWDAVSHFGTLSHWPSISSLAAEHIDRYITMPPHPAEVDALFYQQDARQAQRR